MPRTKEPVKRICYADDKTVEASGVQIPELDHKANTYLTEMSRFLRVNSLLISAPRLSVTLFTPDPAQANTHPKIKINDSELPLVRSPKLLRVYLDTIYSFNTHCVQVANRASNRNNVLKALAGTNLGQQKETLLVTYKALRKSIANYAAPVWSTNASAYNICKIQRAQSEALWIVTSLHKMSSIGHLHSESEMLQVGEHLNLLSAQYLVHCLDTWNVCHHVIMLEHTPREMKETLTRHCHTVLLLLAITKKDTFPAIHTSFVNTAIDNMTDNRVLAQLRTNKSPFLKSYLHKVDAKTHPSPLCPLCNIHTHDTHHLFNCTHIRTTLSPLDLWTDPDGVTALPARWTEKLAGGPQAGTSRTPPTSKGHGSG